MNNLRALLEDVLERDVPGSFVGAYRMAWAGLQGPLPYAVWQRKEMKDTRPVELPQQCRSARAMPSLLAPHSAAECGVWRGGASIFAKAVLTAYGSQRDVHLVDSFQGLPPPTTANDFDVRGAACACGLWPACGCCMSQLC